MSIDVTFFGNLSFGFDRKNISYKGENSMNNEIILIRSIQPILNISTIIPWKFQANLSTNLQEYWLNFLDEKIK